MSSSDEIEFIESKKPSKPAARKPAAVKKEPKASGSSQAGDDAKEAVRARMRADLAAGGSKPVKKERSEAQKLAWANHQARKATGPAGPSNPGSKEIPEGAPNCLAGLKFVFTGELDSLSRDESVDLAKRYGGQVTGAPSGATSFVVVGNNAGPSKLRKIATLGVSTLDEDGFLDLIRTRGSGKLTDKQQKKADEDMKKIKRVAQEMEAAEREDERKRRKIEKQAAEAEAAAAAQASASKSVGSSKASSSSSAVKAVPKAPVRVPPSAKSQLWTTKYAPTALSQVCGNKTSIEKITNWLQHWEGNRKGGFKKPGKDAIGTHRAVLISGSPGIGKTSAAHLIAKSCGYEPLELNASDARSKKLIETGTNIDNQSMDGWMKGQTGSTTTTGFKITHRTCLIFDEVDGMSGGDRGGTQALNALIKKTKVPMILICNDKSNPKMKTLTSTCATVVFRKPTVQEIRSRVMSIAFKEKIKISAQAVDQLIQGANSDIRQVLNMLSTWKLSKDEMSFDEGKELAALNEKNSIMTPFTITEKLFGPYMFSQTNRLSLSQKMEYYFQDFSFMPLFVQENYAKHYFARANNLGGAMKAMKELELLDAAADSISEGDVMDRMIHGPDQQWSLLPNHAIMSTIRPAYFCYGQGNYGPKAYGPSFPLWMGQNSKTSKNYRHLNDIQIHMRLRTSANQAQIRQHYVPALAAHVVDPFIDRGTDAVDGVIDFMDSYFLAKEDWDAMVELGVGSRNEENVLKQIPTAVKSAFTRNWNKKDHPVAVHKAIAISFKKVAPGAGVKADTDDVLEDDAPVESSDDDVADGDDLTKDKLIKNKAAKKGAAKGAAAKKAPAKGGKGSKK